MNFSSIISWTGATTGTLGLVLQGLTYLKRKPKVKITLATEKDSLIIPFKYVTSKNHFVGVSAMGIIILNIALINKRPEPVTIGKIEVYNRLAKSRKYRWLNVLNDEYYYKTFPVIWRDSKINTTLFTSARPSYPFRLNGLDYKIIQVAVWETQAYKQKVKLRITLPTLKKHKTIKVQTFQDYLSDRGYTLPQSK